MVQSGRSTQALREQPQPVTSARAELDRFFLLSFSSVRQRLLADPTLHKLVRRSEGLRQRFGERFAAAQ